uniref:Uncharacterized protein n=1 Tax=Rhodnius prolixus TaxID=13249 RepID=T1I782_RHOPR
MVYQLILSWLPVFVTLLHTHNVLHDVMKHWLSVIPQLDVIIGLLQNFPANPTAFGCIKCDLLLRYGTGQKKVITSEEEANLFSVELDKEVDVGNVLCGKCRRSTRLVSADPNLPSTSHSHHETFPQDRDRVERQLSELSNLSASGSSNH